jgi:hypothetical protein
MRAFLSASMLGLVLGVLVAGASSAHATPACINHVEIWAHLAHVRSTIDGSPMSIGMPSEDVLLVRRAVVHEMVGDHGGSSFRFQVRDGEAP